jgi:monoamine oxidase
MGRDVTRRRFLQLSALAAPAAPALLQRLAQPGPANLGNPIVVVGAGLAGLRAADVLRRAGRQVVVLEARERAGGRVLTIRAPFDDGLHAEAGPIRIAGVHQSVLRAARSFGLTLTPFASSQGSPVVAMQGKAATAAEVARGALTRDLKPADNGLDPGTLLDRYVGVLPGDLAEPAATADSYARWGSYDRLTWPEFLRSRGATPEAIKLMTVGGDATDVSALYVLRQFAMLRRSTQRYKIQGGMDLLPRAMASALEQVVRYNAPVVRVTRESSAGQSPGRLPALRFRVEYRANARVESLTASRIIFAIPFTTLRDIEIRPRLSKPKEHAIAQLSYYSGTRFLLQSRSRFWRSADLSGSARTDRATEVWDSTFDQVTSMRGILGASVGGGSAGGVGRRVLDMTAEESLRFGIDLVADAFPAIRSQFEKGFVQRWALDPWSRGAFPVFKPGEMSTLMPTIARPENGIHFAGEHTSSWTGWMEGALQSGERAAREVLNS